MSAVRSALGAATGAALFLLAASGAVPAQTDDDVSVLAGSCANCHGTDGRSPGPIPPIAGRPEAVLRVQLESFKAGKMPNTTVMTRLAKGYTDEQLAALARYFANIKGGK